jgi:hypothetical protein
VDLPPGTYAFGTDLSPFYGKAGTYEVTLSTGKTYRVAAKLVPWTWDFFGVTSNTPIEWVTFTYDNDYFLLDNFTIGKRGDTSPPTASAALSPAPGDSGWSKGDVQVSISSADNAGGAGVKEIVYSARGAQSLAPVTVAGGSASLTLSVEGQTAVTFFARDAAGNVGAPQSVTVRIDRTAPTLSTPSGLTAEATGANGAVVPYVVTASDAGGSGLASSPVCSPAPGSLFPIGATLVNCRATDSAGNVTHASFQVSVVDAPPVLTLPATIIADSTEAGGARVSFAASAEDRVDGVRPITCSHGSGDLFPVGQTAVRCEAVDTAGGKSNGSFLVYVLEGGQEGAAVGAGEQVTVQPAGGPALTFGAVTEPGVTTVSVIADPAQIGEIPEGFAVSNVAAYEIDTTAVFDAAQGVTLAFKVPADNNGDGYADMTEAEFNALTVLHNHNGTLEELEVTSRDFPHWTIYAKTYSFSPFYLAKKTAGKVAAVFDRTQAYKSGSTIPVRVKLLDVVTGRNISASETVLKARAIRLAGSATSSAVQDAGQANPDNNFRFVGATDGGSYLYNLSTKGFAPGKYTLSIYAGTDRSFFYTVQFEIK